MFVRISGGLGNQMFHYAFAKAMQQKGNEIFLVATGYDSTAGGGGRKYSSSRNRAF